MITASELESIAFRCDGLQSIAHVYEEVQAIRPNADATELKRLFLDCLEELLRQGRVKFLGEGWIRDGSSVDSPLMFGDQYFDAADEVVNGLRQPIDSTPKGVAQLIGAKWPAEVVPAFNVRDTGFDPIWFEKWYFSWCSKADQ